MADTQQVSLLMQGATAWNIWRSSHPRVPIDLSAAVLRRLDLSGADLSEADLSRADLRGAKLSSVDFCYANLCATNLQDAYLERADLSGAIAWQADFRGATLRHGLLVKADARESNFSEANLIALDARDSYLSGIRLEGAYAMGAQFQGANLCLANLCEANFRQANLTGAYLRRCHGVGANLCGANLTGADISHGNFSEANLSHSNLSYVQVQGTNFSRSLLTAACIDNWSVDSTTAFDDSTCDYLVLHGGDRYPQGCCSNEMAVQAVFQHQIEILELVFSRDLNWAAFAHALAQIKHQNSSTTISIQQIQHRPDQSVVVYIQVISGIDRDKIYRDLMAHYDQVSSKTRTILGSEQGAIAQRPIPPLSTRYMAMSKFPEPDCFRELTRLKGRSLFTLFPSAKIIE